MKLSRRHSIDLLCLFFCLLFGNLQPGWAKECGINLSHSKEKVGYRWIYDGDTIQLNDGRKLRLIGIDTPEIGKKGNKSQPYARKAKQALKRLLATNKNIFLSYDEEKKDRYGRLLAYAFLTDGTDIQAELIAAGLAISIVVGVNDANLSCYRILEQKARQQKQGLWSLQEYRFRPASNKKVRSEYAFYRGKITRVKKAKRYWNVDLNNSIEVRISKKIVPSLNFNLEDSVNKSIQVRGPLKRYKKRNRVWVYHMANIKLE